MIINLFPNILYATQIEVPLNITEEILSMCKKNNGVVISNVGGWQSESMLNNKSFSDNYLKYFLNEFDKKNENIPKFYVTNYWLNVNKNGDYNVEHDHGNSHYSFCWYLKTTENSGDITFINPNSYTQCSFINQFDKTLKDHFFVSYSRSFNCREGNCYFFPSNLRHFVEKNNKDTFRISMYGKVNFL